MAGLLRICTIGRFSTFVILIFFGSLTYLALRVPEYGEIFGISRQLELQNNERRSTQLVILILSSPENRERRDAIRKTWLKYANSENTVSYFAICTRGITNSPQIQLEATEYGDLIQLTELFDSYEALTSKLLASFQWLIANLQFSYVLKVDDDTFARVDMIFKELTNGSSIRPLYWGFFDGRARIKKLGRWAEQKWTLCDRYLPHARGGGYVLSGVLVDYIVSHIDLLQKFNSEDISVGTWMAPLDIDRVHDPRFDTEHVSRGCSDAYIVTHKQNITAMFEKYNNLLQTNHLCGVNGQFKTRHSYVYNWSVMPSLCCIRNDSRIP